MSKDIELAVDEDIVSLIKPKAIIRFAKVLQKFVHENKLSVKIQGNPYCMVDGWKFAGQNFGLSAIPDEPVAEHARGEYIRILFTKRTVKFKDDKQVWREKIQEYPIFVGFNDPSGLDIIKDIKKQKVTITREIIRPYFSYRCNVRIVRLVDGVTIGAGSASCSNLEMEKVTFDESSVRAMVQTRGIGRGYRNTIGHIMKAAGFEPTPAEEMPKNPEDYKDYSKEAPAPKEENKAGVTKMDMNDKQLTGTIKKIQAGEITVRKAQEHFQFLESQHKKLHLAEYNYCLLQVSKGEMSVDKARARFTIDLTPDQISALEAVATPTKKA